MIIRPLVDPAVIVIVTVLLLGLVVVGATRSSRSERPGWLLRAVMVLLLAAIAFRPGPRPHRGAVAPVGPRGRVRGRPYDVDVGPGLGRDPAATGRRRT